MHAQRTDSSPDGVKSGNRLSRTLTAGQLITHLSKVHPNTPVVMEQSDEPCGDYGVRGVEFMDMKRDDTYSGIDVWHEASWLNEFPGSRSHAHFDPPQQVVYLSDSCPYMPTVDGELAPAALTVGEGE